MVFIFHKNDKRIISVVKVSEADGGALIIRSGQQNIFLIIFTEPKRKVKDTFQFLS